MQKDQRIGFRASVEEVGRLKQAAGIKRMSLTMFILTAALHMADKILNEKQELVVTSTEKVPQAPAEVQPELPAGYARWTPAKKLSWQAFQKHNAKA